MTPSDLLLLDEPTNHLDLDAIVWLEEWLKKYQGTLMLISHDRTLVDECCQQIFHINRNRIDRYSGNYTEFEHQRAKRLSTEHDLHQKQKKKSSAHGELHTPFPIQGKQGATGTKSNQGALKSSRRLYRPMQDPPSVSNSDPVTVCQTPLSHWTM